jgi:predicted lipoprotein with Yx(FWY)xxD motif
VAAFATLALAAAAAGPARETDGSISAAAQRVARMHSAVSIVIGGVGAVSILALTLLGVAVANASGEPAVAGGHAVTLKTAEVGGATVLTNAHGLTLYWFAADTPTTSKCTGSCAAYWPPVLGVPRAGPGVTGRLGTISRGGRTVQATYDGHPLYAYIGDNGPGQANGNNLDLNGGYWYEVRVSG